MKELTLDKLVRELLIESGEQSLHKYASWLQHGLSGLREFNLDVYGIPKIVTLTVNDNDTVDLPEDYIAHIRIAVCGNDGNLHTLGFNRNLCFPMKRNECGNITANTGTPGTAIIENIDGGNWRNGQNLGRQFGIGGGTNANGYYRIDERNGFIALQGYSGGTITLEYLADLERNSTGEFTVHPYLVEAIKCWIFWKTLARNPRIPANQTLLAKQDFRAASNVAKRRMVSFTIEEAKQVIRKTFTMSPKI